MRLLIHLAFCLSLLAAPAGANERCGSAQPLNACELATDYETLAKEMLPWTEEDFGIAVTVYSTVAKGPELIVRAKTLKSAKALGKLLVVKGKTLQEMQTFWKVDAINGFCNSVEGPDFLLAGGRVVFLMTSADRKPILNFVFRSCERS